MHNLLKLTLTQLGGMIRYEFMRNWRRKGLPMMLAVWLLSVVLGTNLFAGPTFFRPSAELVAGSPLINKVGVTLNIMIAGGGISTIFAIFTLSILASELIPIDRHLGVMEWFEALPLGAGTYLLGKLLGMWTAVFSGILIIALLSGVAHWLWLGAYDLSAFARLWLIAITGIALFVSGITIFITAWIRSRRWSIFVSLGLSIVAYAYLMPGFLQFIAHVYMRYFEQNLPAINAEVCRIQPDVCGQPLMLPGLFPVFITNMGMWGLQLTAVFILTALLAWGGRIWEKNR